MVGNSSPHLSTEPVANHRAAHRGRYCECETQRLVWLTTQYDCRKRRGANDHAITFQVAERRTVAGAPNVAGHDGLSYSGRQSSATLTPTGCDDGPPCAGRHTMTEAVLLGPPTDIGLERSLHGQLLERLGRQEADRRTR